MASESYSSGQPSHADVTTLVGCGEGGDVEVLEGTAICGFVFRAKVGDEVIERSVGEDVD